MCQLKNEKSQLFNVFKCKVTTIRVFKCVCGINLCSHVAQGGVINKKSNISAISYYIDVCVQERIRECPTLIYKPFYSLSKFCMFLSLELSI